MPSFFMPIGGSRKMVAWCKHNILWFFLKKNKNWTKCRLISKKSVLYRDCSHEDSPSLNGNLSFLTQFLLLPLKFSPFLWRHMASAECYCGSPRPHNAVQVRRMPPPYTAVAKWQRQRTLTPSSVVQINPAVPRKSQ